MRILITGGFGFVGGRLAQYLQHAGHQVVLGTRSVRAFPEWLAAGEVVETDWANSCALETICTGIDVVIHAAGMNAQDCAADPELAMEFNGAATACLVDAACRAGVRRFIYLSTAHVYASPLEGSITEEMSPTNSHPYAASHLAGENAVLSARRRGEIEGMALRLSNAFGAPTHKEVNCWTLLVNDLCRQAVQRGELILRSSGLQKRDFVPLAEVCRVIAHLASCDLVSYAPSVINIGTGVSRSLREMALLVRQRCKLVLDVTPEMKCLEPGVDEKYPELEYRSNELARLGLAVIPDNDAEIDRLLSFCASSFGSNFKKSRYVLP